MDTRNVLAIDLGASGGRVVVGRYAGNTISTEEVHRFVNEPVEVNGTLHWDILYLLREIKQGMLVARQRGGFDSLAIATWGVDYGLLTASGRLIGNPVHYRDARTRGLAEKTAPLVADQRFYDITGTQMMEINTAYQLLAEGAHNPGLLAEADTMLMTPDLLNYFLTGVRCAEASIASTSQLFDAREKRWSWELLDALGLPRKLFCPVVPSGTPVGPLLPALCRELGLENTPVVTAACGHDTQCALVAVPARERDFAFISCGTWALFGTELDEPILTEASRKSELTNECGFGGKTAYLKNINGLWLIQESRRQWRREGAEYSFQALEDMAAAEAPLRSFIPPNHPAFASPGNLPQHIRAYCEQHGQPVPQSVGAVVRCINESLALQFRKTLGEICANTGRTYSTIHMLGGGAKSPLLCQMTADATGCQVLAGPDEATVWGNIAAQLISLGELPDLEAARAVIRASCGAVRYTPGHRAPWDAAYEIFGGLLTC